MLTSLEQYLVYNSELVYVIIIYIIMKIQLERSRL